LLNGTQEIVVFPAYHLHPEFGWFCPSPSLQRKVRLVLVTFSFLVVVGALALTAGRDPGADRALLLAHGDGTPSDAQATQTDGRAAATSADLAAVADATKSPRGVADESGLAAQVQDSAGSTPVAADAPTLQAPPKNARKPTHVRHNDYVRHE
jgi:hypothetical protein